MLCQGFQPIPPEEGDHQHLLDKVAASFYSPLSTSATVNNPETPISDRQQGDLDLHAQLEAVTEGRPSALCLLKDFKGPGSLRGECCSRQVAKYEQKKGGRG